VPLAQVRVADDPECCGRPSRGPLQSIDLLLAVFGPEASRNLHRLLIGEGKDFICLNSLASGGTNVGIANVAFDERPLFHDEPA
jgi:hypothetical protein